MSNRDVISKAEVLDIYAELYDEFDDTPGIIKILHRVYDKINHLKPQEQVERKKGFWLYPTSLDCHCSVCGEQPKHESGESVPLYDYCPYCGAEMEVKWDA